MILYSWQMAYLVVDKYTSIYIYIYEYEWLRVGIEILMCVILVYKWPCRLCLWEYIQILLCSNSAFAFTDLNGRGISTDTKAGRYLNRYQRRDGTLNFRRIAVKKDWYSELFAYPNIPQTLFLPIWQCGRYQKYLYGSDGFYSDDSA